MPELFLSGGAISGVISSDGGVGVSDVSISRCMARVSRSR